MIGGLGGSSMFAVQRKSDRHAFLFNGPQLGFAVPELFVEFEIHAPGYDVRGVTAPGVPLIGIGHNGNVAWGFTSGLSDEDDLYAEKLVAGAPERYEFKGEQRAMECRDEVFRFAPPPTNLLPLTSGKVPDLAAGSKTERICRTVHGPVQVRAGNVAYARRYAIFGRELETLVGLDELNRAKTVRDVDVAMQHVTWNENVIAADSQGNIGYWHPGLHPLRPLGYDERLPYPGTGEAEWRGLLDRAKTPHVINPKQGWLANWNNVPSEGWTAGDGEAQERQTGPYHRVAWLMRQVGHLAKSPTFAGALAAVRAAGTTAQQRPLFSARLRKGRQGATGKAKALLDALAAWDGSYHRTDAAGTVDPGVAIWEQFKEDAAHRALDRLGGFAKAGELSGTPGTSHAFDMTLGESYAVRTMTPAETRAVAAVAFDALAARFATEDVAKWREKRRLYDVAAQGAGSAPELPFFDRGTWEQFVELGP
jgi:acyl-homoserine lactone acylase PvdQ